MKISVDRLRLLAPATLRALGCAPDEADLVATHLIEANLRGHDSHGVGMLPFYIASARQGTLKPNTPARLLNDGGAILQFAGDRGFGQRTGREAMDAAIARAQQTGLVLMTLSATHHLGRIGSYGEQAVAAGMISIHFVNVIDFPQMLVAPFNGSSPRFGTNPVCIAIPGGKRHPAFVLDFATSMVAYGKARVAYLAGRQFADDVLLDAAGHPTREPRVMFEPPLGALRPIAGHKGGGLIMAAELLAGLLSGGGSVQPAHPRDGGIVNNMTTLVIDPARLVDMQWFAAEYDALVDYVKSSPSPDPADPVQLAGDPERQRRAQRLVDGIEIADGEWDGILAAAAQLGVDVAG